MRSTTPISIFSNTPPRSASTPSASTSITRTVMASCRRPTSSPPPWRVAPRTTRCSCSGYNRRKALREGYWRREEELGAPDISPYRAGYAQTICVVETDAEAERLYKEHLDYFYNRCLHVYGGFADAPGYRTIRTIQSGALSQYAPPTGYAKLTWKDLIEGGHVIAGSPETVRQRVEELCKSLRVGNLFCLLHVGNMPKEKCMYSTRLFAEKVMPKLRNIFPEYADDSRFWCQPIAQVKAGNLPSEKQALAAVGA